MSQLQREAQADGSICQLPPNVSHRFVFFIHDLVNSVLATSSPSFSSQFHSSYLDLLLNFLYLVVNLGPAFLMWTPGPISPRTSSLNLPEERYTRRSPVVTWLSPQENDVFGSWDTLTAKWISQEVLDSPAFRLCKPPDDSSQVPPLPSQNETEEAYLDNSCGSKISPTVEESDGSFLIRL